MSPVKPIPDGYHSIQPYLYLRGAAKAIEFYRQAFGAVEITRVPRPNGLIMHAEIRIGDSVIMLADEMPDMKVFSPRHYGGAPASLMLYVENCDAVHKQAVAAGGKSVREPKDEYYGDRMSGIEDPFGFQWFIATHVKDVSREELEAATAGQKS